MHYSPVHKCSPKTLKAGNQGNHQNFNPSLLSKNLWLLFMGLRKFFFIFFWKKKSTVWQNEVFLSRPFWIFFFEKKNFFFCWIPWKIVKGSWIARMGRNFDDYPGFQPFRSWANTYAQDCMWYTKKDNNLWNIYSTKLALVYHIRHSYM